MRDLYREHCGVWFSSRWEDLMQLIPSFSRVESTREFRRDALLLRMESSICYM